MIRSADPLFRSMLVLPCAVIIACSSKLTICDIAEESCQQDIYYADLRVRGDGVDPFHGLPPVRVITEDQYRQEMLDQAARSAASSGGEDQEQKAWDAAFALLRFISANSSTTSTTIEDRVSNVAAYYSVANRDVTVISKPTSTSEQKATRMQTLAHELIHALQDRAIDFRRTLRTDDEYLAHAALIEGDASLYEALFVNELGNDLGKGVALTQSNIVAVFRRWADDIYANFDQSSPLFFPQRIRYPLGSVYLSSAWSTGGNAAVRRAYASAPVHSLGYLRPDLSVTVRDCPPPEASGYIPFPGYNRLGAIYFYAFLRAWSIEHAVALVMAESWRGDLLRLALSTDGQHTAVSWRIELDGSPYPGVVAALTDGGTLSVTVTSSSMTIAATTSPEPASWVSGDPCR